MSLLIGIARLGRDAETRYTQSGEAVTNVALAFSYGKKDQSGNRPTQWVEASLWGDRGVKSQPFLTKGSTINAYVRDAHIETFQKNDGTQGFKLTGILTDFEFSGGNTQGQQQGGQQATQQRPPQQQQRQQSQSGGNRSPSFSDMDDDIPFASIPKKALYAI